MKKIIIAGLVLALLCGAWMAFSSKEDELVYDSAPLSIMVDGVLYLTGGEAVTLDFKPAAAGYITEVSVGPNTTPQKDGTSNFEACVNQPYAYVNGSLVLYYNGQWNRCYTEAEWAAKNA